MPTRTSGRNPDRRPSQRTKRPANRPSRRQTPIDLRNTTPIVGMDAPAHGWLLPDDYKSHWFLSRFWFHGPGVCDTTPLRDTPLAKPLAVIAKRRPGWAGWLEHEYDQAVTTARHAYDRQLETEEARKREAVARNRAIAEEQDGVKTRRDTDCVSLIATRNELKAELKQARLTAAKACAAAGIPFNVQKPSAADVLQVKKLTISQAAVKLNIPAPVGTVAPLHKYVQLFITFTLGAVAGVSFAIAAGAMQVDDIFTDYVPTLAASATGSAILLATKTALSHIFAHAAMSWRSRKYFDCGAALLCGLGCFALIQGADAALLRAGLLAQSADQAAMETALTHTTAAISGSATGLSSWLLGFVTTFGVLLLACAEAATTANNAQLIAQADAEAARLAADAEALRRADPDCRTALAAVSEVQVIQQEYDKCLEQIKQITDEAAQELAVLEKRKEKVSLGFGSKARKRLEAARNDFLGALVTALKNIATALRSAEPDPTLWAKIGWRRLRLCCFGWHIRLIKKRRPH